MPYDPPNYVVTFNERHNIPYPLALDVDEAVSHAFGDFRFVPTSFLIDPEGLIVYRQAGKLDVERARRMIMKRIDQSRPDP